VTNESTSNAPSTSAAGGNHGYQAGPAVSGVGVADGSTDWVDAATVAVGDAGPVVETAATGDAEERDRPGVAPAQPEARTRAVAMRKPPRKCALERMPTLNPPPQRSHFDVGTRSGVAAAPDAYSSATTNTNVVASVST
jgi:hypothetical protein